MKVYKSVRMQNAQQTRNNPTLNQIFIYKRNRKEEMLGNVRQIDKQFGTSIDMILKIMEEEEVEDEVRIKYEK